MRKCQTGHIPFEEIVLMLTLPSWLDDPQCHSDVACFRIDYRGLKRQRLAIGPTGATNPCAKIQDSYV